MTVVEAVLEMLRAYFPDFELEDGEPRQRPKRRSEEPKREPRRRSRPARDAETRRWRARAADETERAVDPALARCFAVLGISPGADLEQVRRVWIRLVRQHHPDFHGADPERQRIGTELLKQINNAYGEIQQRLRGQSA